MNDQYEDDRHFKLRLDKANEEIDQPVPSEVNELKLEKITQRVTLISILIPVLIVIVLVIAYLDIKKRVVATEDTGEVEMQKLSTDLESRFSSLSVRQAKLEEALEKLSQQNNQATAAIQVRLEKLNDSLKEMHQNTVSLKEFSATKTEIVKQINGVIESSNQAGDQVAAITRELKSQIDRVNQTMTGTERQLNTLDRKLSEVSQNKIDKAALDLALRLETLKIETAAKSQIQALQTKINALEDQLARRQSTPAPASPPPAGTGAKPEPAKPPAAPSGSSDSHRKIEEQTLGK